jgi:DNA-binding HxlR family transcriptional regulator
MDCQVRFLYHQRMPKSYGQSCAIARGLETLGERWSLLIVRELLIGPRRFTDLVANLPGVPTSLLGERLRALESQGLLQKRRLPPPAASTVYELTGPGRALEEAVLAIGRWATLFGRRATAEDASRPEWQRYALKGAFRPQAATDVSRTFEIHFEDQVITAEVRRGRLELAEGSAAAPDLVVKTAFRTFMELVAGRLTLPDASKRGLIDIEGGTGGDAELLVELFSARPVVVPVDLVNRSV